MTNIIKIVIILAVISIGTAFANNRTHFLSHGPSVAAFGRGETGAAIFSDVSSIFYNPSLSTDMKDAAASISYYKLSDDAMYNFIGAGYPLPLDKKTIVSIYAINLRSGEVELRENITDTPKITQPAQWAYALSVSRELDRLYKINVGASIKYVDLNLYGYKGGGTGIDLGVSRLFQGPVILGNKSNLNLGMSGQNVLRPAIKLISEEESFSTIFRLGAALSLPVVYRLASYDTIAVFSDFTLEEKYLNILSGIEYCLMNHYFARAGYYKNHFTTGLGYRYKNVQADYAFDLSDFDYLHRLGFAYFWGKTTTEQFGKPKRKHTSLMKEAQKSLIESQKLEAKRDKEVNPLFKSALANYNKKEYLRAADKFRDIMIQYPEYESARIYYDKITNEVNSTVLAGDENDFEKISYARGYVDFRQQNFNNSLNEWEKVLQINPKREEVKEYSDKVKQYLADAEKRKKEKEIEGRVSALFNEGVSDFDKMNWIKSIKKMEKVQAVCRNEPFPSSLEWKNKAQEYISKAIKELANMNFRQKEIADPGKEQETIVDTEGAEKNYTDGLILYAQGKIADAIRQWEIAVRLDPNHPKAHKALERAKEELNSPKN